MKRTQAGVPAHVALAGPVLPVWLFCWPVDDMFAADYVINGQAVGTEGVKQAVTWLRSTFPDAHITFENMIAEGDKVVVSWAVRGTQHGVVMDIPPTGKQVTMTGINVDGLTDS